MNKLNMYGSFLFIFRKRLYAGTVPTNKEYAAGTIPANKKYAAGTVPARKVFNPQSYVD